MRPLVLPGPIIPQPTMPTTMRSDGPGRPARPSALAGINVGNAMAAAVVARNWRRENSWRGLERKVDFMVANLPKAGTSHQQKIDLVPAAWGIQLIPDRGPSR